MDGITVRYVTDPPLTVQRTSKSLTWTFCFATPAVAPAVSRAGVSALAGIEEMATGLYGMPRSRVVMTSSCRATGFAGPSEEEGTSRNHRIVSSIAQTCKPHTQSQVHVVARLCVPHLSQPISQTIYARKHNGSIEGELGPRGILCEHVLEVSSNT